MYVAEAGDAFQSLVTVIVRKKCENLGITFLPKDFFNNVFRKVSSNIYQNL